MSIKYGILSLLLFVIALFLAIKSFEAWAQPIKLESEKGLAKRLEKKTDISSPPAEIQKDFKKANPHLVLSENNIFHPDRKDFPIITGAVAEMELTRKSMQRPQVVLYGVTISEDFQSAIITNTGKPLKKGERENLTLKFGERIGEYKLAKVLPDRIVMEASDDTFEVLLYDPKMPKKRSYVMTENKPTSTITPSAPTTIPSESPKVVPPRGSAPMEKEPVQERVTPPLSPRTATPPISSPQAPITPPIALPPTPGEPPIVSPPTPGAPPVSASY